MLMGLFTPFQKKPPVDLAEHPAHQIGQRLGQWFDGRLRRAADALNVWQHRVGFKHRNRLLLGVLLALLTYFIWDLLTLF